VSLDYSIPTVGGIDWCVFVSPDRGLRRQPRIGGEQCDDSLVNVIGALDQALSHDLAGLDGLLAQAGSEQLQAWLHRVSGVLGMAEATSLAQVGLVLERDLAGGRGETIDRAVRDFADDAAAVLALLREHHDDDRL